MPTNFVITSSMERRLKKYIFCLRANAIGVTAGPKENYYLKTVIVPPSTTMKRKFMRDSGTCSSITNPITIAGVGNRPCWFCVRRTIVPIPQRKSPEKIISIYPLSMTNVYLADGTLTAIVKRKKAFPPTLPVISRCIFALLNF